MKWNPLFRAAAALAATACIASCASTQPKQPDYLAVLAQKGVAPATYAKIHNHRVLDFNDILNLVQNNVPGGQIAAYLKSTRAPYNFSRSQINTLVRAGADSALINYLGKSQGDFLIDAQDSAQQEQLIKQHEEWKKFWDHPYYNDPYYYGPAPFGFAYPGDWFYAPGSPFFGTP